MQSSSCIFLCGYCTVGMLGRWHLISVPNCFVFGHFQVLNTVNKTLLDCKLRIQSTGTGYLHVQEHLFSFHKV